MMNSAVIVALISFAGTLAGTAGGIIASAKLIEYRLEQMEKRIEKLSRDTADLPVIEERFSNISRRVSALERRQANLYYFENGQ